jgi:3-hydroxyacyl-[acyl-carrier-protein] dehydratase
MSKLPYSNRFCLLTNLTEISENGVVTILMENLDFKGHFKEYPVTPGVILTEGISKSGWFAGFFY